MAGQEAVSHHVTTRQEVERCVNTGWLDNEGACLARTKRSASGGRYIAWICNSIDDVVRICCQPLSRGAALTEKISLFHNRFALYDRQRIEKGTPSHLGKDNSTQRAGRVLIATRVIE